MKNKRKRHKKHRQKQDNNKNKGKVKNERQGEKVGGESKIRHIEGDEATPLA